MTTGDQEFDFCWASHPIRLATESRSELTEKEKLQVTRIYNNTAEQMQKTCLRKKITTPVTVIEKNQIKYLSYISIKHFKHRCLGGSELADESRLVIRCKDHAGIGVKGYLVHNLRGMLTMIWVLVRKGSADRSASFVEIVWNIWECQVDPSCTWRLNWCNHSTSGCRPNLTTKTRNKLPIRSNEQVSLHQQYQNRKECTWIRHCCNLYFCPALMEFLSADATIRSDDSAPRLWKQRDEIA